MKDIIWKKFTLDYLFDRQTPPATNSTAKELNISDEKFGGCIALITRAETNNGIRGYIEKGNFPTLKSAITYNDQFSFFLFHNYEFTTIKDHLSVIRCKESKLQELLDSHHELNGFLVILLNHIFSKEIFNFNFTGADYRFSREIILLPCLEVSKGDDYIWEENGHYFTLPVEYIKKLMGEAKELKEKKTIRLYEAERAKYEAERAKYEAGYKKEKSGLVWKKFLLGDLFDRSTSLAINKNQKDLNILETKDETHSIALISASRSGSGRVGYIEDDLIDESKVSINKITFDDQWGYTYFQREKFVITGGHNAILEVKNINFKALLDCNIEAYSFISLLINKITIKSDIFGYGYKINNKFDREIILLPCLEVSKGDDYIWEENGHYFTLAVEYIKKLMGEAKELKEKKTIRLYEAERAKYEAERAKYEAGYKKEKSGLVWKKFLLGDLFDRSTSLAINKNQKDLNILETKDETHSIALISASRSGSGRVGYIEDDLIDESKVSINKITFDDQWGYTYFQREKFVITGGHNAILEVKNINFKALLDCNIEAYSFISLLINKITIKSDIFGYGYKINNKFDREIILLPCLEVSKGDDYIWEENGHYFTLAVEYISYIYLTGRVNYNQKLIENYTYQY